MFALDGQLVTSQGVLLPIPTLTISLPPSNHILGINGLTNLISTYRSAFYVLNTVLHDLQVLTHLICIIALMR